MLALRTYLITVLAIGGIAGTIPEGRDSRDTYLDAYAASQSSTQKRKESPATGVVDTSSPVRDAFEGPTSYNAPTYHVYNAPKDSYSSPGDSHQNHGPIRDSYSPPGDPHHNYGTPSNTYGSPQDTYNSPLTSYEKPSYGAPSPAYGASSPAYGAPSPAYDAPSPAYGAPSPAYGAPSPAYDAPSPAYGAPSHSYGTPAHSYGAPSAAYGAPVPMGHHHMAPYGQPNRGMASIPIHTVLKILLKVLIFKVIVKFIAVICVLLFIPKFDHDGHKQNDDDMRSSLTTNGPNSNDKLDSLTEQVFRGIGRKYTKEECHGDESCKLNRVAQKIDEEYTMLRLMRIFLRDYYDDGDAISPSIPSYFLA